MTLTQQHAKFLLDFRIWTDESPETNNPKMRLFSFVDQITGVTLTRSLSNTYNIGTETTLSISLPVTPVNYLFVKADRVVSVRLNGDATDNVVVTPSTPGTTEDGLLFLRTTVTQLDIRNNDTTNTANVLVMVGG